MSKKEILKLIRSMPNGPKVRDLVPEPGRYNRPSAIRRRLMRSLPIASEQITGFDLMLAEDPRTHPRDLIEILWRTVFCQWMKYIETDDPDMKRALLYLVGSEWEQFMELPEKARKQIGDYFAIWKLTLASEEAEEAEKANAK
jgi:hypothetical protein